MSLLDNLKEITLASNINIGYITYGALNMDDQNHKSLITSNKLYTTFCEISDNLANTLREIRNNCRFIKIKLHSVENVNINSAIQNCINDTSLDIVVINVQAEYSKELEELMTNLINKKIVYYAVPKLEKAFPIMSMQQYEIDHIRTNPNIALVISMLALIVSKNKIEKVIFNHSDLKREVLTNTIKDVPNMTISRDNLDAAKHYPKDITIWKHPVTEDNYIKISFTPNTSLEIQSRIAGENKLILEENIENHILIPENSFYRLLQVSNKLKNI